MMSLPILVFFAISFSDNLLFNIGIISYSTCVLLIVEN